MKATIDSIAGEYRRYKALAERSLRQLAPEDLVRPGFGSGNSIATIVWHIAGNLRSRFTDFLTTDGEKPWRDREGEFAERSVTREELLEEWERGWAALFGALDELTDGDLAREVRIRRQPLTVAEALHRSLAHASYHVGQIVYVAKAFRGDEWEYLSIPPGGSAAYNREPTREKPPDQATAVDETK